MTLHNQIAELRRALANLQDEYSRVVSENFALRIRLAQAEDQLMERTTELPLHESFSTSWRAMLGQVDEVHVQLMKLGDTVQHVLMEKTRA